MNRIVYLLLIIVLTSCSYDKKPIYLPGYKECKECNGTGHERIWGVAVFWNCSRCNGFGSIKLPSHTITYEETVTTCNRCNTCGGSGYVFSFYGPQFCMAGCDHGYFYNTSTVNHTVTFDGEICKVGEVFYSVNEGCFIGNACRDCSCEQFLSHSNISKCENCGHSTSTHTGNSHSGDITFEGGTKYSPCNVPSHKCTGFVSISHSNRNCKICAENAKVECHAVNHIIGSI